MAVNGIAQGSGQQVSRRVGLWANHLISPIFTKRRILVRDQRIEGSNPLSQTTVNSETSFQVCTRQCWLHSAVAIDSCWRPCSSV